MNAQIPNNVLKVLKIINDSGFESNIVGGAVRDILMNKEPQRFEYSSKFRAFYSQRDNVYDYIASSYLIDDVKKGIEKFLLEKYPNGIKEVKE